MSYTEEWAEAYEQERGRKPTELALQIAEHIEKVCKMLAELGRKDAQEGEKPYPAEVFPLLVRKVFHNIPEGAAMKEIADLWQSDYMDGFEEGGEADGM